MGFAVGELADLAVVTSDNPRSEDPAAIAEAVAEGCAPPAGDPLLVLDRRAGHRTALELADERSLVLVAGKGHEATRPSAAAGSSFSDQDVIRAESRGGAVQMTAAELALLVGGTVDGMAACARSGAEVDSRRSRGAISSSPSRARRDGHEFVAAALEVAAAALVRATTSSSTRRPGAAR
jgi:hypothetical protein